MTSVTWSLIVQIAITAVYPVLEPVRPPRRGEAHGDALLIALAYLSAARFAEHSAQSITTR